VASVHLKEVSSRTAQPASFSFLPNFASVDIKVFLTAQILYYKCNNAFGTAIFV